MNYRFGKIIVFVIISGLFLTGCFRQNSTKQIAKNPSKPVVTLSAVDLTKLKSDYEKAVREIVANLTTQDAALLSVEQQKLLALTVPAEYRQLHLALVLWCDQLQQLLPQGNQQKITQSYAELKQITHNYSWLAS